MRPDTTSSKSTFLNNLLMTKASKITDSKINDVNSFLEVRLDIIVVCNISHQISVPNLFEPLQPYSSSSRRSAYVHALGRGALPYYRLNL